MLSNNANQAQPPIVNSTNYMMPLMLLGIGQGANVSVIVCSQLIPLMPSLAANSMRHTRQAMTEEPSCIKKNGFVGNMQRLLPMKSGSVFVPDRVSTTERLNEANRVREPMSSLDILSVSIVD
jgi:hypothetical protein